MIDPSNPFDRNFQTWKAEQAQPWAGLRYRLEFRNIFRHMDESPLSILDAGGGNAGSAILFAHAGHQVTVVDSSSEMIDDGLRSVSIAGLENKVSFFQADLQDLDALFPKPSFDLVLSHNVLQYLPDPGGSLIKLIHCLRPGGLVSIITTNRYAEIYKAAFRELNLERAMGQINSAESIASIFKIHMRNYTETEVIDLLEGAGCQPVGLYGLLCLTTWLPNEPKYDPAFMAKLETLEFKLANRFPYYLLARFYQGIAFRGEKQR